MNALDHISEPLYSADKVKLIERKACELEGYELFELMQRAGQFAWDYLQQKFPASENITVVAGAGNNAGDGFILAILANNCGKKVQVLTVKEQPTYRGDAAKAFEQLQQTNVAITQYAEDLLSDTDVLVDAILGTGLSGSLRQDYLDVIHSINAWHETHCGFILSLDIPSGLDSENGTLNPVAIHSDECLSFINLKPGMVTGKAREYCHHWDVAELDIPDKARVDIPLSAYADDAEGLIRCLPKRQLTSHKGSHGHLLLIGGDDGFGGAILMATQAAARVGVGRYTIVTRDSHIAPFLTQFPEAMIRSVEDPYAEEFQRLLKQVNAIVIGPGLGTRDWGKNLFHACIAADCPMIIDADGLNHLANIDTIRDNWVLTPHPGEASRLLLSDTQTIESSRYQAVADLQQKYQGTIILKGAGTLISNGVFTTVCTDGNPGMASAGMGDILSGIVGSLLAQGIGPFLASRIAVALHAKAADRAALDGEKGLLATDLMTPLRQLVNL